MGIIKYVRHIASRFVSCISKKIWPVYGNKYGNIVDIDGTSMLRESCLKFYKVKTGGGNELHIGRNCSIRGARFEFHNCNNKIIIGDNVKINANRRRCVTFVVDGGKTVYVGNDCLFSDGIEIWTTDFHNIYDENDVWVNPPKDVVIGKHTWIARDVRINKGVKLADDIVIGNCSVVAKSMDESNVVIAGNPASVRKRNIYWGNRRKNTL